MFAICHAGLTVKSLGSMKVAILRLAYVDTLLTSLATASWHEVYFET
jgi:hypothetical protein